MTTVVGNSSSANYSPIPSPKAGIDNRVAIVPIKNKVTSKNTVRLGSRTLSNAKVTINKGSPSTVAGPLHRPPTTRPGDIGFRSSSAGFRMRPPPSAAKMSSLSSLTTRQVPAIAVSSGGTGRKGGGAAALTAAAAAKANSVPEPRSWSGRLRSCGDISGTRGAPPGGAGGGCKALGKAGESTRGDAVAASAILAKLARGGSGKGRGGGTGGSGVGVGDLESLQEQVRVYWCKPLRVKTVGG